VLTVLGAENDSAAHSAADIVLASRLQDHVLTDRKDRSGEIARHPVFRPVHINRRPMKLRIASKMISERQEIVRLG
jgi:hypothetical protein